MRLRLRLGLRVGEAANVLAFDANQRQLAAAEELKVKP